MLREGVKYWILKYSKVFFCGQEAFDIRERVSILKAIIRQPKEENQVELLAIVEELNEKKQIEEGKATAEDQGRGS